MARRDDTVRFTVSLPDALREELDRRMVDQGYPSRSEFVRDLIRERLVHEKWGDGKQKVVGVLTISYDHHQRELANRIIDIQHRRYVNVLCTTHVHMDHDNCLEVIIIRGRPPEIEKMGIEIGGLKGVKFAKLTRASAL
ncbi:MAG: nickel-responsive transcriptional regulator NikR [Candidatus Eisenbacteria bacterium]